MSPFTSAPIVDQAIQLGRVLNLVLRFGENCSQHPRLVAQLAQQGHIMHLQLRAALGLQALPVEFGGNANIAVIRRLAIFIRHLQKDQVSELLQIVAIAHPVVAQGSAKTPDF
jgi:hypothetical protein